MTRKERAIARAIYKAFEGLDDPDSKHDAFLRGRVANEVAGVLGAFNPDLDMERFIVGCETGRYVEEVG